MKYCKFCGAECKDDATFCPECGKKLDGEGASVNEERPSATFSETTANNKSDKSKIAAALLQIFLGSLGIGRFYTGHTNIAVAQLIVSIVTCGIGSIWGFIDGIIILCTKDFKDADGRIME